MKALCILSTILVVGQVSLASVLDKVQAGQFRAQCAQNNSDSPITFIAANILKDQNSLSVELLGSAYNGTVNSSLKMDFSKSYSKNVETFKTSLHDNIVLPGTTEEHTIVKNSNETSAGIKETVKTAVGFVTVNTKVSTSVLSIQNGQVRLEITDSEGGKISCALSK